MEQTGKVFLSLNPVAWLYVLLVYGSYKATPVLVAEKCLRKRGRKHAKAWKKLISMGFIVESTSATAFAAFEKLLSTGYFENGSKILIGTDSYTPNRGKILIDTDSHTPDEDKKLSFGHAYCSEGVHNFVTSIISIELVKILSW